MDEENVCGAVQITDDEADDAHEYVANAVSKVKRLSENCKNGEYCRALASPQKRFQELLAKGIKLKNDLRRLLNAASPVMPLFMLLVQQSNENLTAMHALRRSLTKFSFFGALDAMTEFSRSLYDFLYTLKEVFEPYVKRLLNYIRGWLNGKPEKTEKNEAKAICCGVNDLRMQIENTQEDLTNKAKECETNGQKCLALIYVRGSRKLSKYAEEAEISHCRCFSDY